MTLEVTQTGSHTSKISRIWPDYEPLPNILPEVEAFDPDLLPKKLRPYIENSAKALQCPPDFLATASMVALASLVGRKVCIRPKTNDPWTVVPNLWGANVGLSAQKKTPAQSKAIQPIHALDAEEWERNEQAKKDNAARVHRAQAEITALRQQLTAHYKKAKDDFDPDHASQRIAELEVELDVLTPRRYITNDSTIEKLAELLSQNPTGMLLLRDELMGWLKTMDRMGHEGDRAFYLECWAGDGSAYYDRIGRGTIRCDSLCLSIHGSIQPGPLSNYVADALGDGSKADGLLQRFQLMVWPDRVLNWRYVDEPLNPATYDLACSVFRNLDEITPESAGAEIPESGLPFLHFDEEAQRIYIDWVTELNKQHIAETEHPAMISHLGKFESLQPALALILHLADGFTGPVSAEAAAKACDWCDYLESHARRVYASCLNPELQAAHRLVEKIKSGKVTHQMTVRDLYHKGWSGLNRVQAGKALQVLEDYGWLLVETIETGGRPSETLNLHPNWRERKGG